jgi:hypothetical protein
MGSTAGIVRTGSSHDDDADALRVRVSELEAALSERSAAVTRLNSDLATFRIRYRQDVGSLHEQLEELERAIAEAELGELSRLVTEAGGDAPPPPSAPRSEPEPRLTSDAVRRLFRDVAKAIHPDLAHDDVARDRRHTLMVEANRAYALGDEERLRRILQSWENSPEAVQGTDPEATRQRLLRRIAQIEEQLIAYTGDLDALRETPLFKLKVMVDEAAARGKDLIADQVRRLKRDLLAARNRLDAMLWHP